MLLFGYAALAAAMAPNVVFILVDDVGYNDVGYHNSSRMLTPHIDNLAKAGVRLTNYYVQPICTPTRAALMTGRYPFRYGVTGYTIDTQVPWGIPLEEAFLPEFLRDAGYETAAFGKWHLGFFKPEYLPLSRGFEHQAGFYLWGNDHYTHEQSFDFEVGFDWNVQQVARPDLRGQYSGDLVRNDVVAFVHARPPNATARPYFAYVAFQEAHAPFQVDPKYLADYPHLASTPEQQALAGMITHTDTMVGDIMRALDATGALPNTLLIFSSDNGGPMAEVLEGLTPPQRFDPHVSPRNYPFRGQKHEVYEGGVRVAGFVYSPLLPAHLAGSTYDNLFHITDWLPTLATATGASLGSRKHLPLDGHDHWSCLLDGGAACSPRSDVVMNINVVCDVPGAQGAPGVRGDFTTECPAPKAALREGDLKILAECYNMSTHGFTGRLELYNVSADPAEQHDLSKKLPSALSDLSVKLLKYAAQAALVAPLHPEPPFQGEQYWCAKCRIGHPSGVERVWQPWCEGGAGVACPLPSGADLKN